ncbi:integrin-linked protein kinase family [Actinidia rufa]|uniref:Integrin-linked protein kinase family n=1 Tax=Actinidia rufa TaxID=165716 RepID=A0A7J0DZN7_9ERIC|nr:integrin-linked protein kinase family [Actinidia rufa]
MESKAKPRFALGRQSSLAPERNENLGAVDELEVSEEMDSRVRLMYLANEGDLEGIREGCPDVVELLLKRGAEVNLEDRWGSTCHENLVPANEVEVSEGIDSRVRLMTVMHVAAQKRSRVYLEDRWGSTVLFKKDIGWRQFGAYLVMLKPYGISVLNELLLSSSCRLPALKVISDTTVDTRGIGLGLAWPEKRVRQFGRSGWLGWVSGSNGPDFVGGVQPGSGWQQASGRTHAKTPLADAIFYKNHDVIKLLEEHGATPPMAPMHVQNYREVPEYEIDSSELDFTNSVNITKGTFRSASWRGIQVAVKLLGEELFTDEDKIKAFRDELALLQTMRHPNVVQFLGAVTQSSPMMIVTEYLPKGDLRAFLRRKGALRPVTALMYALDIARLVK